MRKIKNKFTKWYVKRGYTYRYDFGKTPIFGKDPIFYPGGLPKPVFDCPWWVKPLLMLFSPSVYHAEAIGRAMVDAYMEGMYNTFERRLKEVANSSPEDEELWSYIDHTLMDSGQKENPYIKGERKDV